MNNQLQISWAQPCEETFPISNSWLTIALQKRIQKLRCWSKDMDRYAKSLNTSIANDSQHVREAISRSVLR